VVLTTKWLRTHPFLLLGIGSFLLFVPLLVLDLDPESLLFRGLAVLWRFLGVGPHTAANLLARHAPGIPGWLDATLVVVLGLFPYAAADAVLGQLRRRRPRTRSDPPAAGGHVVSRTNVREVRHADE
jgi:hypothetical protein